MNVNKLLAEALAAGLTVTTDGPLLVVRGPQPADDLVQRLLARKPELMVALEQGRRVVEEMQLQGHLLLAVGTRRLSVTPPLWPDQREALAASKEAVIAYLRATTTPPPTHALDDLEDALADEEIQWPPQYTLPIDWQTEYRLERTTWRMRLRCCSDRGAQAIIRDLLTAPAPTTEAEWMQCGARWADAEHRLRTEGRLPATPCPARDP